MKKQLPEGVTPEMITKWKEQYGESKLHIAHLVDGNRQPVLSVIIRTPDRQALSESEKYSFTNPDKSKDILVKACVLTDKERVLADEQLFFSAYAAINKIAPLADATVDSL